MSPDNLETLKVLAALMGAFAALLGGLYAIVTRPILHTIAAQSESLRAEIRATRDLLKKNCCASSK